MSTYRYLTSDILTGAITGDWLPITPQSMARNINQVGTFTGALQLGTGTAAENRANISAVEPEKSVLWTFQDQAPVWAGIIWDWPHTSILDGTLPLAASTCESLFQRRQIDQNLVFADTDIFDIFRALATFAVGKTPNGGLAGLTLGSNQAGVTTSVIYQGADLKTVYDAWTDLVTAFGFEYSIRPSIAENGTLLLNLDLGYPLLGLPLPDSGLVYNMPGNLLDYSYPRTGSSSANRVIVTAQNQGGQVQLNINSDFELGTAPWVANHGATLTQSSVWASSGTFSALFHGNGSTANPNIASELFPVQPETGYTATATVFTPQGWSAVQVQMLWFDARGVFISDTAGGTANVAANTATQLTRPYTSPAGAVQGQLLIQLTGTPSSSVLLYSDQAYATLTAISTDPWRSQLPHGQDNDVLDLGYPLLETSASLSAVIISSQAQVDDYADGALGPVTGTQLQPMLTVGAGQRPAAKDITLGSFAQFNATSVLHPANDDGSPGLQLTARVIGWQLFPPSQNQAEYTQVQLGRLEAVA